MQHQLGVIRLLRLARQPCYAFRCGCLNHQLAWRHKEIQIESCRRIGASCLHLHSHLPSAGATRSRHFSQVNDLSQSFSRTSQNCVNNTETILCQSSWMHGRSYSSLCHYGSISSASGLPMISSRAKHQPGGYEKTISSNSRSALYTTGESLFLQPSRVPVGGYQVRHSSTEPTTAYESLLDSQPVHLAEEIFKYVHSVTGLPWWATIMATTFTLRFALTLPLAVYSQNIRARVESLQPEALGMAKRAFVQRFAARAKNEKWSEKRAQRAFMGLVRRYSKELYVRDNCHPAKGSILFLVQLPMWIFLSLGLRNMTGAFSERMFVDPASIVPELATGGALWFPSLAAPDPMLILPVLVGILNLSNIEMHALHKGRVTRLQRYLNNTLRGISLVMIPVAAYVPSAMALYWSVSAFYGLGQNILLKVPSARRALGIRQSKTDSDTPFQDMGEEFMERYVRRSRGAQKEGRLEGLEEGEGEAEGLKSKSKTRSKP